MFATVLSLTLLVVGFVGYRGLGVDRFPKVDFPFVSVITTLPGSSPEEIETEITDKIERQVNSIGGIESLQSTSSDGVSMVMIQFALSKNVDVAAEEVRSKVALAKADLPPDARDPVVAKFDVGSVPVISYVVASSGSLRDTYEFVDKVLRRRLESISGVGEVQVIGGRKRQINVVLDPYRLRAYGLGPSDVSMALARQNTQVPGGLVEQGASQLTLRTPGRVRRVAEFGDIPLKTYDRQQVYVRDVAEVTDSESRATSLASFNGREGVVLQVIKQSDANAVAVIHEVKARMAELESTLPRGFRVQIVRDQSTYIEASLFAVREHLIVGAFLAALVVLLFLGNLRSTVIAALAIPTSIIATFALMKAMGFTQNNVTLLALTLSVGIVIDDAIVVLENIFRVLEEEGLSPHDAAIKATREIGLAVLAITLSLVMVFLPVAFMSGIVGRFLNSFGVTMACAIAVSMFVSFSLTPMLCSRWLRRARTSGHGPTSHAAGGTKGGWFGRLENGYAALLAWSLRHKLLVVVACGVIFFSTGPLLKMAKKNFLPVDDESQFQVQVRAREGTSLEGTRAILETIADEVKRLPEVRLALVTAGDDRQSSANKGTVFVRMNEVEARTDRQATQQTNMQRVREEVLPRFAGRGLTLSVQEAGGFGGGSNAAIQVAVAGPELDKLSEYSQRAVAQARRIAGVADVDTTLIAGEPEMRAQIDRAKAAAMGVSVADVAQALRLAVAGDDKISAFDEKGEQYEVHVRLAPEYRRDAVSLALLTVPGDIAGAKQQVLLNQVARLEESTSPASIDRYNRQRQFMLMVNILPEASQGAVTTEVDKVIAGLQMGPGYGPNYTGRSREFQRTFVNFATAALLSFIFMYLVIAAQFESFIHAIVIMLTLPLTFPFAIASVVLTRDSFNIFSMLGTLVLLGVVKKNAILQIDRANQLRAAGMGLYDATVQASKDRLRPILMTTLAFVAGMIPLVLSSGTGSATNRTIGSVIVGGQVFSLLLTLVAAPVFYVVLDSAANSRLCRWVRRTVFRADGPDETPAGVLDGGHGS